MSRALVGIILLGAASIAAATDETLPWERGSISIGGFLSTSDSELRFDTSSGVGVTFDPADVLDIESDDPDALLDVEGKTRLSYQAALLYLKLFF